MPDISRSDSNRSDASRPRVSFNRDVHVKRINGPRTANAYSLSPDGNSFVPTSVRRERPMTKTEMSKEAEVVLKQVDKVSCTATSNMDIDKKKSTKKKRKNSFSFLKKSEKLEKTKHSSSDVDSGSSQEYRIYKVNGPPNNTNSSIINENNKINDSSESFKVKARGNDKKMYDFMSLDRKKLKKEKKNRHLEYLSLEKTNEILDKMKKEKQNKTLISLMFDKIEGKNKKPSTGALAPSEIKEETKIKPKIVLDISEEKISKKKQLSPIIESPGADYFDKRRENNVEKMIKMLTEKNIPKLTKNTGTIGVKEPQSDMCHNDNRPFSYMYGSGSVLEKEGLGNGREVLKSTSPTSDVIYAQVIVGGRDGNAQKPTVNERVASNEVGRVFVGEESNQSQVGLNYKIDSSRNDCICETVTGDGDEMWQAKSEYIRKKERLEGSKLPHTEFSRENLGLGDASRSKSRESERRDSPSPARDNFTRVIPVAPKYEPVNRLDKSPTNLRDLSMRREILLSRSESQAKERFNSLKRLQEPAKVKRHVSNVNGIKPGDKILRNDVKWNLENDIRVNEKFFSAPKKIPKDVELIPKQKRESKLDVYLKEKKNEWSSEKVHVIKTDDDDNFLQKLSRLGKSKSFIGEKPKSKRMEKMKMFFKKKKEGKSSESEDDPLASRYIEYRGSDLELSDRSTDSSPKRSVTRTEISPLESSNSGRKPSSTPQWQNSMGTLTKIKNDKNKEPQWTKPLEKMNKKGKQKNRADETVSETTNTFKPVNLRFFGDTDQESTTNEIEAPDLKSKYGLHHRQGRVSESDEDRLQVFGRPDSRMTNSTLKGSSTGKFKSKYDLDRPDYGLKQMNHGLKMTSAKNDGFDSNMSDSSTLKNDIFDFNGLKYGPEVIRSLSPITTSTKYGNKETLRQMKSTPVTTFNTLEEPLSRKVKSYGNLYTQDDGQRSGRRRFYDSSAESATEGDSSQHSSKSMIYLHAATVGDIPGPRNVYKSDRRSQSREELSSIGNSPISTPTRKTLSRSISVLAPWRPKHNKEDRTMHYDSADWNKGKPPTGVGKNKRSSSRERKPDELRFNTIGKENRRRKDLLR